MPRGLLKAAEVTIRLCTILTSFPLADSQNGGGEGGVHVFLIMRSLLHRSRGFFGAFWLFPRNFQNYEFSKNPSHKEGKIPFLQPTVSLATNKHISKKKPG